jgi:type IV pilus assembly protein PilA
MRQRKREAGFTLIELLTVVAIIGILAVLGTVGVRTYLASAKSAEAISTLGAINQAVVASYDREAGPTKILIGGKSATSATHQLCPSSQAVPATDAAIQNKKYVANTAANVDYHVGGGGVPSGWVCLRFELNEPQYYRYKYTMGSAPALAANVTPPAGASWLAEGRGDLDGDGTFSGFVTGGKISNGLAVTFTQIAQVDSSE